MYVSLPLMECLVVPETPPLYGVAVLPSTPNKNLMTNPPRGFPRTIIPYSSLKGLSHLPLQRWRGPYRLGYFLKTSTFLCSVIRLLGSNGDLLWKRIC